MSQDLTIKDETILSSMLCRICATEHSNDCMNNLLTSIHNGLYFVDMLQECLQRSITKDNGFPLGICLECTANLIIVYNFHLTCNGSEKKFRELAKSDRLERKVKVIADESESDVKQSYFIDCAAIDVRNTNCDGIDGIGMSTDTHLMESHTEQKLNKLRMPRYECYLCKLTFRRIVLLRQHIHTNHYTDDKLWSCPDCQKRFSQKKNLMKHLYKHTSTSCEHCEQTFTTLRDLQQHCRRTHKDQMILHQCDRCPKKFVLNAQLRIHTHIHNTNQRHNCSICNETFVSEMQLKGHTRAVHTTYLCSECGKTFKNKSLLTSHQKVHNSEKPFVCSKCPSRFKWKVALTYHMTIHQQERKHVCETCGMSFTTRSAMKGHMRIHTGERPFACDKCSKRFYRSTHLKRHYLSHTGEKPYQCQYCDKGFRQCSQLNKHLRLHIGENTYQCDLCPRKFKFKADMKKHYHEHYESKDSPAVGTVATSES